MTTTTPLPARVRFDAMIESRTLDQSVSVLLLADTTTAEGMMIRTALIKHIETLSPAIEEWVSDFYSGPDEDPRWDIDYPDAILLARDALGI